ncbi:ABC transporter, substrate-binding protein, family 3 [Bacteriovorax sp. BSW11_IV]|uniref:substrate-binding periplasmic protein n=1 Tax=Bacteriovorax sp. BSW11_IV TaxID=1353529 RepID=UPI00038A4612|nr:transporter substrate-binding domain-containing protein [Bacteriovorax sp. BSW11_IV]EQC48857.1 ABC transporter, substrate-binding protein, family 3 [Bacteriovorax sp. BSW11_IV]
MRKIAALLLTLMSISCLSKEVLRLGVSLSNPPYCIAESNSGFEVDLIKEVFKESEYDVVFVFATNARLFVQFMDGEINGILNANIDYFQKEYKKPLFETESIVTFQNYGISLKKNSLKIQDIDDLRNLRVNAFQNATNYLGPKFKKMATQNKRYNEIPQQRNQPEYLLRDRADIIISEKHIFTYYLKKFQPKTNRDELFTFHPLFPAEPKAIIFKSRKHKDDFNRYFAQMKANGQVEKLRTIYGLEY